MSCQESGCRCIDSGVCPVSSPWCGCGGGDGDDVWRFMLGGACLCMSRVYLPLSREDFKTAIRVTILMAELSGVEFELVIGKYGFCRSFRQIGHF